MSLYKHTPHPHQARNVNELHRAALAASRFSQRIAIALTQAVGTMECAYVFMLLALLGLPNLLPAIVAQWVQWLSQTFIQLVMLSILMVGQMLLGRHAELMAEEQYQTTQRTDHATEQIVQHLAAQDEKIMETHDAVLHLTERMMEIRAELHTLHEQVDVAVRQAKSPVRRVKEAQ